MKTVLEKLLPPPLAEMARTVLERCGKVAPRPLAPVSPKNHALVLECLVSYNSNGGYCIPRASQHRPAARTVLAGEVWEPETIAFMTRHSKDGDIVHAGTYFGDFLPALSRSCPGRTLWAFEPNPENFRCALITIAINNLKNVELRNAGLGQDRVSLSMKVADGSGRALGGASQVVDLCVRSDREEFIDVSIQRLDDILPPDRPISIIQLDVEGFERPALAGAMETIRRWKPILILETLPDPRWLSEEILSLGYRLSGTLHENSVLTAACPGP